MSLQSPGSLPPVREGTPGARLWPVLWTAAILAAAALWLWGGAVAGWAFEVPRRWILPLAGWISGFVTWLTRSADFGLFTFQDLTRAAAAVVQAPYAAVLGLLSTGFPAGAEAPAVPPLPWVGVAGAAAILGLWAGGARLALLTGGAFAALAVFGQWQSAMVTLASILIAVPIGVAGGLALGILAWRSPVFARAIAPVLDLMQTMPVFAYLVPVLILFGFSPVSAIIATVIYALPPMTRVTQLALSRVPAEIGDLGRMVGCTRAQMTWRVMVPAARDPLMVGVNQVIMLSLNMVIIASMIGAGGLGFDVLTALRQLDFDKGVASGLAIVLLAIALDRLSQAAATPRAAAPGAGTPGAGTPGAASAAGAGWARRHPFLLASAATLAIAAVAAAALPALGVWPAEATLSTGTWWRDRIAWVNVNWFDQIEAVKTWFLLNLLVPVKRFLVGLPWLGVAGLLALTGWRLGGWRLGLLCGALTVAIAFTGLWEQAMITVYLCGISTLIAMAIGVPLGILAAEVRPLWPPLRTFIDTLQTLPSFVYLMPAVMLFRVGDFTAMLAVVAFALAPAIRYTATGLMAVDPVLIEAGRAMGCTRRQILTRIKLRLALPEIMLGLNQTLMFALSMLVITALVGTRDLGQEVYVALSRADAGRGLVAGLCIAFIAIIADRLLQAGAARARLRLGLTGAQP